MLINDTIAAIATAQGKGSVGIVRISGKQAKTIGLKLSRQTELKARHAYYGPWFDQQGNIIDHGILIYFAAPNSFTGEDIIELQGHGGAVVLDMLLENCLALGARQAKPGEFSERAFLNDKIDLAQAEAIADLIEASSKQAAQNALRSLQGEFSKKIHQLTEALIALRIYVEAAIDFPEEEIDFLNDQRIITQLKQLQQNILQVQREASQGVLLRDGMNVVIAGLPNAGKSSLLNALAGRETAIVTDIAGTTRDILKEHILIDGMPLHIIDTAGLRDTHDPIEKIGVARAIAAIKQADRILLVIDSTQAEVTNPLSIWPIFLNPKPNLDKITIINNKADLTHHKIELSTNKEGYTSIFLSAKDKQGIELLTEHLKACMGYQHTAETTFSARRRHIQALQEAAQAIDQGYQQLTKQGAGELLAEDLRQAQQALNTITGEFTPDDLLGRIFSSFCIGK